jgi:CRP-like cAMP-binding protein
MKTPIDVGASAAGLPRQIINKGRTIFAAGAPTDQAYVLVSGQARARQPMISEGEFAAGDFLSLLPFLALEEYDSDVIATDRAEVIVLPRVLVQEQWHAEDRISWSVVCSLAADAIKTCVKQRHSSNAAA